LKQLIHKHSLKDCGGRLATRSIMLKTKQEGMPPAKADADNRLAHQRLLRLHNRWFGREIPHRHVISDTVDVIRPDHYPVGRGSGCEVADDHIVSDIRYFRVSYRCTLAAMRRGSRFGHWLRRHHLCG